MIPTILTTRTTAETCAAARRTFLQGAPLSPITDVGRYVSAHGRVTWLETLSCGHTGNARRSETAITQAITAGQQRRCARCKQATAQEVTP